MPAAVDCWVDRIRRWHGYYGQHRIVARWCGYPRLTSTARAAWRAVGDVRAYERAKALHPSNGS